MKAKMEYIDDLKRNNRAMTGRIAQLESVAEGRIAQLESVVEASARQIDSLERNSTSQTEHIRELETDTEAKTMRIHNLERKINEKTKRIGALTQDTEAKARQIRSLELATTTKTERRQYLEKIDQLTEAKESLQKKVSQMQNKLFILLTILLCFMLLMHVLFKLLLTEQVESV